MPLAAVRRARLPIADCQGRGGRRVSARWLIARGVADPVAVAPDGMATMPGDNQRVYITRDEPNNSSGQERHYRGKFVCAPWLSKWLNKIRFLAGSAG
jgi:hypothetical protein